MLVCLLFGGFFREGFLRPVLPPTFAESKAAMFNVFFGRRDRDFSRFFSTGMQEFAES